MSSSDDHLARMRTYDVEIGISEAIRRHATRHVVSPKPVSERTLNFEHKRPRWLRECVAEATGVFFYVFSGLCSIATFLLNSQSELGVTAYGSFFQMGWAFAIGIMFAIIVAGPTSGGHFNPAVTICFALWQGFPWKKVPHYIFSQIIGSMVAGLLVMGIYWQEIKKFKEATLAAHQPLVSATGPAGILVAFPGAGQTNLGYLFFVEFFVDTFIGLVIWSAIDPANPFVSPTTTPIVIGMAYGVMVWGFAPLTISTNLARDLGCRIVAAMLFGGEAFAYRSYCWIALLVNIPATIFATLFYEVFLRDSLAQIGAGKASHKDGEEGLRRYLTRTGVLEGPKTERAGDSTHIEVMESS
ncbi:hypothetical protein VTN02DRAFT_6623 [Thermoascus thermophilus]